MWQISIRVLDEAKKRVLLLATRTEDEDVWQYSITGIIATQAQRAAMMEDIKEAYLEYEAKQARENTMLGGLETTAENYLNNWEATR